MGHNLISNIQPVKYPFNVCMTVSDSYFPPSLVTSFFQLSRLCWVVAQSLAAAPNLAWVKEEKRGGGGWRRDVFARQM